jgi:hypothetical protein
LLHYWAGPIPRNPMSSVWKSLSRLYVHPDSCHRLDNR